MRKLKALLQQSSWSNSFGSTIYQWGVMAFSKCPLERRIFGAQRAKMRSRCNSKTKSFMRKLKALLQQSSWSNSFGSTIYQWGVMAFSKCPLERRIFGAQRAKMRSRCNSKTKSQRSEPNWLLKYLIIPNFCAKFQPNRLTPTFGPWNTFSDNSCGHTTDFLPR